MDWFEFLPSVIDQILSLIAWASHIYPFPGVPISFFWLFASLSLFFILWSIIFPDDDDN